MHLASEVGFDLANRLINRQPDAIENVIAQRKAMQQDGALFDDNGKLKGKLDLEALGFTPGEIAEAASRQPGQGVGAGFTSRFGGADRGHGSNTKSQ